MAKYNQAIQDLLRYNAAMLPRKRSRFDKSHSHTTTMDSAYLVPLMWDRVLPGDEKEIRVSALARMATPLHPTMDTAYFDCWAFYVPDRLWWTHAKEFYGENKDASFNPDGQYTMPYLKPSQYMTLFRPSSDNKGLGSLNDYFGFPLASNLSSSDVVNRDTVPELRVTAGLHRSYQLIWNEWFRNSSVQPALQLNDGDTVTAAEWEVIRPIRKVNKLPDYFTSLLREPQAGDDVLLPLGDWAPVVTRRNDYSVTTENFDPSAPLKWHSNYSLVNGDGNLYLYNGNTMKDTTTGSGVNGSPAIPANLWADLTSASAATVNNLRAAITVQHLLEIDSIAGKRYQQILQAHFGVFTPDATLQRPELLGASRTTVGMRQVLQSSESNDTTKQYLGDTAAFSLTSVDNEWVCNKAFTEPGFILVLGAIRPTHSYSQGIDPLLTKINRYDHYWPVFDNLGNQPVPRSAIYAATTSLASSGTDLTKPFGYAEAWTEYRIKDNRVSGLMRPDAESSLASWNYSSNFAAMPTLDGSFVQEDEELIERTIAAQNQPQFIVDCYFDYKDTKNMSVHSVPGLTRL